MKSRHTIAAAIGVVLSLLIATAPAVGGDPGSDDQTVGAESSPDYGVRTARLNDGERPGSSFDHAVESGSSITDAVEIFNFTGEPMVFDVYSADMIQTSNGGMTAASRTAEVAGTGTWIVVSTDQVEVPPTDSVLVDFGIEVPVGTPPGQEMAALLVEAHSDPTGGSIESKTRIGIRVNVEVIGEVDLGAVLGDLTSERIGDAIRYRFEVSNTGSVTFEVGGVATVTDWGGDLRSEPVLEPESVFVAPGEQVVLIADWVDPPLFGRFDATATVDVVVGERSPVTYETNTHSLWIVPWMMVLSIVVLTVAAGWLIFATRTRRKLWLSRRREERQVLRDYRRNRDLAT